MSRSAISAKPAIERPRAPSSGHYRRRPRIIPRMPDVSKSLDRAIALILALGKWLALPVVLLLFAQWPLRDLVHCCSREANDFGQIAFALFVALAITAATRANAHLRADAFAERLKPVTRQRLRLAGNLLVLLPWSCVVLVSLAPAGLASLVSLEHFPDTRNPGYFLIRLAALAMALLVLLQAIVDLIRRLDASGETPR